MKILILKPSSLGDVVHALPVLRLLKQHLPESRIHWWIDAGLQDLLRGDPDLEDVLVFERRRWASPARWGEAVASLREIRTRRFDWVLDLQSLVRSGLVSWLADARLTVGLADLREGAPAFYDLAVPRPSPTTHAVDWYLEVLRVLGVPVHPRFTWLPLRGEVADRLRAEWPDTGARWVALQPGARWHNKRWAADHFARTIRLLQARGADLRFVILGGAGDQALAGPIAAAVPGRCLDLTGRTTLPEMVEWIRRCSLLVSNDTGPMHIAAALGRPVVALFGPTEPRRTGPYGQLEAVLQDRSLPCVPCLKARCRHTPPVECLDRLTPERVAEAAWQRLAAARGPGPFVSCLGPPAQ